MPNLKPRAALTLVVALLIGLLLQACGSDPTVAPTATPQPPTNESKIDTVLLGIILKYTTTEGTNDQKTQAAVDYARQQGIIDDKDQVTFELELNDPAAEKPITDKITSMGGKVTNSAKLDTIVKLRVRVPVNTFLSYANTATKDNFLADLAAFKGVTGINLVYQRPTQEFNKLPETKEALFQVGNATKNEGVKIMETDKWQAAGFTGKGVTVGIIDGGYKFYQDLLGTYLPNDFAPVDIDQQAGGDGVIDATVHGTAVTEIIHSNAPDAKLFAAAVDGSDDEISTAIDYLVAQNVSIISMSMGGHGSSSDGTSPLEKKVEQVRAQKNILFVFSAGNEGVSHYAGFYDPAPDGYLQFMPGVTKMGLGYPARSGAPFSTYVILNWEQWHDQTPTDLDLFVETAQGVAKISSTGDQRSRPPREIVPLKLAPGELVYIKVRLKPGTPPPTKPLRFHIFTHDLPLQMYTPTMAIGDPSTSKGALAVGAVDYDTDGIAYYSSQGPLPNGIFKPEISGPAGVHSAAYQLDGEENFDGTSASCPQISGLAAVLKSANPSLNADQLTQVLLEHTKDLGFKGPDYAYGYGRGDAGPNPGANDASPQNKLPPSPTPNLNPNVQPTVFSKLYPTPVVTPGLTSRVTTVAATTPAETTQPVTPPPSPQPITGVNFTDTFKDTSSGLPNSGQTSYQNGKYNVKAAASQLTWGVYPTSRIQVEDFAAEVKVQGISSDSGLYGLVFWHQDAQNYYMMSVTGAGMVQVGQYSGGDWKEIMPWTKASNWKSGTSNTLRIVASNGALQVLVNDRAVTPQATKASGSGAIGFASGSFGGGAVDASFTDFRLATR